MFALGLYFLRQTFIYSIINLIDNVWIKFKLEVKSIIINKYFLPLLEKYYYYYKSEGLFITLSLVVLDFRCLLAPKSLAGYIFNWFSVYYFFPTGSFSSLYLVLLGSGSNISLLDLLYFIWAMLNIILFFMDIIYLLINDVKSFKNYSYICLIIYIFSMLLLIISSVVLILLVNIFITKVVSILSVYLEKYILNMTGWGPDPNSGGGPDPNSGGGPDPNSGGGPNPNSGGMGTTGKNSKKRSRTQDERDADLKDYKAKNPFPMYIGQTEEEYKKVNFNKGEITGIIQQPSIKGTIRSRRTGAEVKADVDNLMENNPQKDNEDTEQYIRRIKRKDYYENSMKNKSKKLLKDLFLEKSKSTIDNKRRTRAEVEASRDNLKKENPKAPGQSPEEYEKYIKNLDHELVKKRNLNAKIDTAISKLQYDSQFFTLPQNAPESSTQAQNAPESSTQAQNAGESFSQDDIYGVSSDEERRKRRKNK